jgi:hypothetical protein
MILYFSQEVPDFLRHHPEGQTYEQIEAHTRQDVSQRGLIGETYSEFKPGILRAFLDEYIQEGMLVEKDGKYFVDGNA